MHVPWLVVYGNRIIILDVFYAELTRAYNKRNFIVLYKEERVRFFMLLRSSQMWVIHFLRFVLIRAKIILERGRKNVKFHRLFQLAFKFFMFYVHSSSYSNLLNRNVMFWNFISKSKFHYNSHTQNKLSTKLIVNKDVFK